MSGFPREGGGTVTLADVEALFTAANQVFNGTGAGTGVVTANPELNSLGLGAASPGTTGEIFAGSGTLLLKSVNANSMIQLLGGGGQITLTAVQGVNVTGPLLPSGINSSAHAAFSAPAIISGSAFVPNAGFDTIVQIDLAATTLGSLTVTYGPTTGAENTWLPTANVVAGSDIVSTLLVPKGWSVVATATGVTVALSASVHRI